ncbi:MAG: hypothetical protein EBU90_07280 [Proteobacteria bacterium]|nr:hypothetical protein [Pseudomonadota bacterium]
MINSKPDKETLFFYHYLPKKDKTFFNDSLNDYDNLNERIKASTVSQYLITGSIDTTLIDGYRQGVEITQEKHFYAGNSTKIHAGEPGHVLRKNFYGADRNFLKQNEFKDLEYFNSLKYIQNESIFTYPIITHDSDETENYNFNGVIEPLTIRAVAALYSIDVPFEAHSVKGMMMDGNSDITMSNSRILSLKPKVENYSIPPWMDLVDMVGTAKKVPTMAFFNDDKTYVNPFNDTSTKVQLSTNLPLDMTDEVLKLIGSTENYISENEVSAACGWMYDDVTLTGTDSIAFGGLGY